MEVLVNKLREQRWIFWRELEKGLLEEQLSREEEYMDCNSEIIGSSPNLFYKKIFFNKLFKATESR